MDVSAQSTFPIRSGIIANTTGGGGGTPAPVAAFTATPDTGVAALTVTFADTSTNSPSTWSWDFQDDGTIDSTAQNPTPFTYTRAGDVHRPADRLQRAPVLDGDAHHHRHRPAGTDRGIHDQPDDRDRPARRHLHEQLDGHDHEMGVGLRRQRDHGRHDPEPTSHSSYNAGAWVISLKVTDSFNQTSTTTPDSDRQIGQPDNARCRTSRTSRADNNIQLQWNNAGFSTLVVFNPSRPPEYKISKQNQARAQKLPCTSTVITVSDH